MRPSSYLRVSYVALGLVLACFSAYEAAAQLRDTLATPNAKPALDLKPQLRAALSPQPPQTSVPVIQRIEFQGNRRIRSETLRARIFSREGDNFSEEALRRDF
ncbi:MAG TPA: POTRA domain-containing protein, partial [Candidatus Limnocylindria bacterium]|nr:POTRA domain-containing protein [Candidatus Limnocylindria bacterium]